MALPRGRSKSSTKKTTGVKAPMSAKAAASKAINVKTPKGKSANKPLKLSKKQISSAKKKPGGSNVGEYPGVKSKSFAGSAGGAPKGSFPINTPKRAKSALALAHNAPKPSGIKKAVAKKYPGLGAGSGKKKKSSKKKSRK